MNFQDKIETVFPKKSIMEVMQKAKTKCAESIEIDELDNDKLDELIDSKTFVLIDGIDAKARKQLAEKLEKRYGAICFNWYAETNRAFDFDNAEPDHSGHLMAKIDKAKKEEKPFVLLGFFMTPFKRSVIATDLTEGFEKVVSFINFEPNHKTYNRLVNAEFGVNSSQYLAEFNDTPAYHQYFLEYNFACNRLMNCGETLVYGYTHCAFLDTEDIKKIG